MTKDKAIEIVNSKVTYPVLGCFSFQNAWRVCVSIGDDVGVITVKSDGTISGTRALAEMYANTAFSNAFYAFLKSPDGRKVIEHGEAARKRLKQSGDASE